MKEQNRAIVEFINFLDGARLVPSVQQQKRIMLELLALQPGEKVLDIGCGTGDDIRDLAQLVGSSGWCVGVDQNGAMLEEARKRSSRRNQPVEFHQGDICSLPFPEATFDVTRAERLFEHLHQPEQALAEMIRVTRKIQHFESDRRPNGQAGQKLYGLFWDAGSTDLQVRAFVHMNCNYEEMLSFLDIRERVEAAQNAGAISIDEGVAWLEQLAQAGQARRFFMSTNHYLVCGRKT
jgi:ubiquinone/menaquinone biosynthesis C-methylase UbiE